MRVLHIYKTYYPVTTGGCEQVIRTLTKYTSKLGCQNTLLTLAPESGAVRDNSVEVIYFPTTFELASCPISLKFLIQFKRLAKAADIIHFHFPWPFADVAYLLANLQKPTVVTYHSDIVRQKLLKLFYLPVMNKFLSKIDRIVLTSDNYFQSSRDIEPYRHKCEVVPLGICQEDYPPPEPERINYWNSKLPKNFILFIGVLRSYKGLDYLIAAMKETKIPLVLLGAGPEENKLKESANNLKNIYFVGKVSDADKIALIHLSKAIVLPSHLRSEAFGICLLEGLIYGKPLISTDLQTGTSFVNQHNLTGLVVPPANTAALREAIQQLYENQDLANQMGHNGRQHYLNYFTAKAMAEKYFDIYKSLLSS